MPHVLVVDDSKTDRLLVSELLKKAGDITVAEAADGAEALESMRSSLPDLVVTDLQMPVLDGLELVAAVCRQHAEVPVILITAHGSEERAVQALQCGAASYVSKSHLADRLVSTVRKVLARADDQRAFQRLTNSMTRSVFGFHLPNDPGLIPNLVELVKQVAGSVQGVDANAQLRLGSALEEALHEAMLRRNLELTPAEVESVRSDEPAGQQLLKSRQVDPQLADRRTDVDVRLLPEEIRIQIRNEGRLDESFGDTASLDMHAPENRGAVLMRAFMDEISYEDGGRRLVMVQRSDTGP